MVTGTIAFALGHVTTVASYDGAGRNVEGSSGSNGMLELEPFKSQPFRFRTLQ